MLRRAWLFFVVGALAACGLEIVGSEGASILAPSDAAVSVTEASTPPPAPSDAGTPRDAAGVLFCDPNDSTLLLCLPFEGSVVINESKYDQPASVVGPLAFVDGAEGRAVHLTAATKIQFPTDAIYAVEEMTIEAWVRLTSLPPDGGRFGILDNDSTFDMFVFPGGSFRCGVGGPDVTAGTIATGKWTHIGCTGGATSAIEVYVDGVRVDGGTKDAGPNALSSAPIAVGSNSPSGDPMTGDLDGVRIYSRRKTADEFKADATR